MYPIIEKNFKMKNSELLMMLYREDIDKQSIIF